MQNVGENELNKLRLDRRSLEVAVARRIGEYLLQNKLETIRGMTLGMLQKIIDLFHQSLSVAFIAGAVLREQKAYGMWAVAGGHARSEEGLRAVRDYVARGRDYDWLNVCSDVIRLFGELSENPVIRNLPDHDDAWKTMGEKGKYRPEPVFAVPKGGDKKIGWGHRDRGDREHPAQIGAPFTELARVHVKWRGVEKFEFGDASVIKTIDYTYGLPIEGADVSGTTADSYAAVKWSLEKLVPNRDPAVHLIAIATMVPQGHHTIVECAWPLTRQGVMDYHIGFYDTLAPSGLAALSADLSQFNNDRRNQHLFVLAKGAVQSNFLFNGPGEAAEYKKIAGIRTAYGICAGGVMDKATGVNVLTAHHVSQLVVDRISNWG